MINVLMISSTTYITTGLQKIPKSHPIKFHITAQLLLLGVQLSGLKFGTLIFKREFLWLYCITKCE